MSVIDFPGSTTVPIEPDKLLDKAKNWKMTECVVLGWTEDGEFIFGGSHCEIAGNVLLLEIAKAKLIEEATA